MSSVERGMRRSWNAIVPPVTRRFWLRPGHGTELAHHALIDAGWTLTGDAERLLTWTLEPPGEDVFAAGGWINHIPGIAALTLKSHLCLSLRAGAERAAAAGVNGLYGFAPQTFVLPAEYDEWIRARAWEPDAVWIQKPAGLSRGRGVALVGHVDEVKNANLVVQRYITNPHLIDGYKYTLRFYVLIASVDPLIVYLFDDGFTKLASRPFSLDPADRADRFRHLTNPDVLRDDPDADVVSGRNTTHSEYRRRLREAGEDDEWLWSRIRRLLAATVIAAQPFIRAGRIAANPSSRGQFELLGVDVTVDNAMKPWLLECNLSPSLSVEASAATAASIEETNLKTRVVRDTLHLIGADAGESPVVPPHDAPAALALLDELEGRRGRFERLWPSRAALEALAGVDYLSDLDRALLEREASSGDWPAVIADRVEEITCGADTLLYERHRQRVTLLDRDEARAWSAARPGTHGVAWLQEGWLAPSDLADTARGGEDRFAELIARRRHRWNRERVYRMHGLRVAIACATPRQEARIERALAWCDADHEEEIDAAVFVPARASLADVMARIDQLALRALGGVVRRRIRNGEHVVLGGSPFGAWRDRDGVLEPLPIVAFVRAHGSHGDVMLDLVADAPGVVRAFEVASLRALAAWIEQIPIVPIPTAGS